MNQKQKKSTSRARPKKRENKVRELTRESRPSTFPIKGGNLKDKKLFRKTAFFQEFSCFSSWIIMILLAGKFECKFKLL